MKSVMAPKKPQGNAPTDPLLARGLVVVVSGDTAARNALKRAITDSLGPEVEAFPDLNALEAYIHPRSTTCAGRPPVRGFLLDWGLGSPRGASLLETLKWLDRVYPTTPVVTFTSAHDLSDIRRMCAGKHEILPFWNLPRTHPLRQAGLALVRLSVHPTGIFARDGLTGAVLRSIEEAWFKSHEEERLGARRWLCELLPTAADAPEHLVRTVEAKFEKAHDLAGARGITDGTLGQHKKAIRVIWGRPLDSLRDEWIASVKGRGAAVLPGESTDTPSDEAPIDPEPPPRPRRPSARRSR